MNQATILVVDDEPQLRRAMKATLTDLGYSVVEAKTGEEALERLRSESPDLVLLDLNMPGIGGLETCRAIRETSDVPVIILSVRNTERDKVQVLDAGANDYVTNPFGIQELLARVRVALRASQAMGEPGTKQFVSGDLTIDFESRRVTRLSKTVRLTPKEFDLLKFLLDHAGKPVAHRKLLQTVWGPDYGEEVEYLRVVVNQPGGSGARSADYHRGAPRPGVADGKSYSFVFSALPKRDVGLGGPLCVQQGRS